jgi:hypothetical protein
MSGTASNIVIGAGWLYMAPLGTSEPTDSTTALPSAWIAIGYTEDGHDMTVGRTNDDIEVAEVNFPVLVVNSKTNVKLKFRMAEPTARNLVAALGNGAGGSNTATSLEIDTALTGIMLVHESNAAGSLTTNRRKIFRECYPSGDLTTGFKKSPGKTLLDVEFSAVLPDGETSPVKFYKPAGTNAAL